MSKTVGIKIKFILVVVCVISVTLLGNLWARAVVEANRPTDAQVELTHDRLDMGQVVAGTILTAEFPVKNTGGRRLFIRQKSVSCECGSESDSQIVLPGEASMIRNQLDTHNLSGQFEIEWEYTTSSRNMPTFTCCMLVEVIPLEQ